jgi:hypothetical protein
MHKMICLGTKTEGGETCRSCGSNPLQAQSFDNTYGSAANSDSQPTCTDCCLQNPVDAKGVADILGMTGWDAMVLDIQHKNSVHIPHIRCGQYSLHEDLMMSWPKHKERSVLNSKRVHKHKQGDCNPLKWDSFQRQTSRKAVTQITSQQDSQIWPEIQGSLNIRGWGQTFWDERNPVLFIRAEQFRYGQYTLSPSGILASARRLVNELNTSTVSSFWHLASVNGWRQSACGHRYNNQLMMSDTKTMKTHHSKPALH